VIGVIVLETAANVVARAVANTAIAAMVAVLAMVAVRLLRPSGMNNRPWML